MFSWVWKCQGQNILTDLIRYKCLSCNKYYLNKLDEELRKEFWNLFSFSNDHINKFILLLMKGVYPYEYTEEWEKVNETSLPEK